METMKKLCERFNRNNPGYHAEIVTEDSYPAIGNRRGWYTVYISSPEGYPARYHFETCREFSEWINGVVLD